MIACSVGNCLKTGIEQVSNYEVGYGKPPVETRFGAGNNANPIGKTSEQRKLEIRMAEAAAKVQADLVEALARVVESASGDERKLEHVRADVLRLLSDSMDRGFGKAVQQVDTTSSDGSARMPSRIILTAPGDADSA